MTHENKFGAKEKKEKKKKVGLMVTDCQEILLEREGTTTKKRYIGFFYF